MKEISLKSVRTGCESVKEYVKSAGQNISPSQDQDYEKSHKLKKTKVFEDKAKAIEHARKVAHDQEYSLIHGKNGMIKDESYYKKQNFPPRS